MILSMQVYNYNGYPSMRAEFDASVYEGSNGLRL